MILISKKKSMILIIFSIVMSIYTILVLKAFSKSKQRELSEPYLNGSAGDCLENDDHVDMCHEELLPDVDIYLRMYRKSMTYYQHVLLPSIKFFWKGHIPLLIVLDGESIEDRKLGPILQKMYPYPKVCFQEAINPEIYHGVGHERMQRDFFYPEKFTSKKYVGFIDTDTVFVTRLTRSLFFENDMPIIIGVFGYVPNMFWSVSADVTFDVFYSKEVMKCMSYFPVIIQTKHIIQLRQYLEALYQTPFDQIFKEHSKYGFSQFSIMCNYIWKFHRNEYSFYFHEIKTRFKGHKNAPGREPDSFYEIILTPEQTVPKLRTSIHYRYIKTGDWKSNTTLMNILRTGVCYSGGFDQCPSLCRDLNRTALHKELFVFEGSDWTWDNRCLEEQTKHYAFVKTISTNDPCQSVHAACNQVQHVIFSVMERDLDWDY